MSRNNNIKGFASKVKNFRVSRGWTQIQLAQFLGVSRPTIARIEAGQKVSDRVHGVIVKTIAEK